MKKIFVISMLLAMFANSALAAQRFIAIYKNRADDVAEVNYYLERGGRVLLMTSTSDMKSAHCYIAVEYPDNVPVYKKNN